MKTRILLCMMALWAICAAAQPQMPRLLDNGFRLMPNHHQVFATSTKSNKTSKTTNIVTKRIAERADVPTYQVNFVLDFNTETQKADMIHILNEETSIYNFQQDLYQLVQGSNVMTVPTGTYDIIATFSELDTSQPYEFPWYNYYVVREQVTINQDTQINISASEAKNHIHFQTLNIDGEPVNTGKYYVDEYWNWIPIEEGNTDDVFFYKMLANKDYGELDIRGGNFGNIIEGEMMHSLGGEAAADIYINDVSDRYVFYAYRCAMKDEIIYTSAYEVQGASDNITINNDPTKFKLFEDPFYSAKHQGEDLFQTFKFYAELIDGPSPMETTLTLPVAKGEVCQYYIGARVEDSQFGYIPALIPQVTIKKYDEYGSYMYEPVMTAKPLTNTNEEVVFVNNGYNNFTMFEYNEELGDINSYPNWPTSPAFTYSLDKKKEYLGNSCPMLGSDLWQTENTYEWEDEDGDLVSETYRFLNFKYAYYGRFGETKPDDIADSQVSIKLDGEEIITGKGNMYVQLDELLNGEVDATITNESVWVDDMTGSNKAKLHYTAGAEDDTPPTMTMLHFKGANGDVTDHFDNSDDGVLEFTAGDFKWVQPTRGYHYYTRQAHETVEVSYSPYGEDNWNELPVDEVPENYWPAMGWFYTGSLASVAGKGLNGWFDLKIRLTDAAGNWQEQVISPAFRIDDLAYTSVAKVGDNNAHEVARYNMAGQRVDADATGVVIVRMSDGTARKVIL